VKSSGGNARDVICDMVEELGVDILVMGSHGYGFIKRPVIIIKILNYPFFSLVPTGLMLRVADDFCVKYRALLGSVSDYCAQNAKCPVLIVKRPA